MTKGVRCQGMTTVYAKSVTGELAAENHRALVEAGMEEPDAGKPMTAPAQSSPPVKPPAAEGTAAPQNDASPHVIPVVDRSIQLEAPEAVPIRTQAGVMRVWVAPWEDKNGDLHLASEVFTEIEPRRWEVGIPSTVDAHVYQGRSRKCRDAVVPCSRRWLG